MDLSVRLQELQKRTIEHREALLTEEAAKNALVLPFLQSLGYDIFNPSEVIPEYTADVGTKKGEKVDYAICSGGSIIILLECKPSTVELSINHASQLFRYFSVTDARLAILTNGVVYQFYSDTERPNKMDDKPFFSFSMESIKKSDINILSKFAKSSFDIEDIIAEAGTLKLQSQLRKELEKEFAEPSDDFIRMIAARMHSGRLTQAIKDRVGQALSAAIDSIIRDLVTERLSSALNASSPPPAVPTPSITDDEAKDIVTTEEEISGFHIVQAIASRIVDPKRVVMRDAKSYCAILLDDNNRKTIARMHFNGLTVKHFGLFEGREETRQSIADLTEIYQFSSQIEQRLRELDPNLTSREL